MTPVSLHNIDPNILRATAQPIQNAQANAQPQEIQLPHGSLHSDDMQNNVPHDRETEKYRQPNEQKRLSYEEDWVNGKTSDPGTIQLVEEGSYTEKEMIRRLEKAIEDTRKLMQIKI